MFSSFLIKLILNLSGRKYIDVYYNIYKDDESTNYVYSGGAYFVRRMAVEEGEKDKNYIGTMRLTTRFRLTDEL